MYSVLHARHVRASVVPGGKPSVFPSIEIHGIMESSASVATGGTVLLRYNRPLSSFPLRSLSSSTEDLLSWKPCMLFKTLELLPLHGYWPIFFFH